MKVEDVAHDEEDLAGRGMSGGGVGDNWRGYRENTTEKVCMAIGGWEPVRRRYKAVRWLMRSGAVG